jgi:hypothetical protein
MPETEVSKKFGSLAKRFEKEIENNRKFMAANPILELKQKKKVEAHGAALMHQEEANKALLIILAEELTLLRRDMRAMLQSIQPDIHPLVSDNVSTTIHLKKEF